MRVRWRKFSHDAYDYACEYAEEIGEIPNVENFTFKREGEVIGTFGKNGVPYFLINENNKIVEYPAKECEIITELTYI